MNNDEKQCPYCAETIRAEAIRCRHCKSDLSGPVQATVENPSRVTDAGGAVVAIFVFSGLFVVVLAWAVYTLVRDGLPG